MLSLKHVVHLVLACLFFLGAYHDAYVIRYNTTIQSWFGRLQSLPVWNLYLQAQFFSLTLLTDVIVWGGLNHNIRSGLDMVSDVTFASIIFPLAVMVTISFSMSDDPLVFDPRIPRWMSILIHMIGMPAVGIEMVMVDHHYERYRWCNFFVLSLLTAMNNGWVVYVGWLYKCFDYPYISQLPLLQQICSLTISAFLCIIPFKWGELMHHFLWRRRAQVTD